MNRGCKLAVAQLQRNDSVIAVWWRLFLIGASSYTPIFYKDIFVFPTFLFIRRVMLLQFHFFFHFFFHFLRCASSVPPFFYIFFIVLPCLATVFICFFAVLICFCTIRICSLFCFTFSRCSISLQRLVI